MNKSLFLFIFCMISGGRLFSQTTVEEYNYVTKGYGIQVSSGLDMKKGYQLSDLSNVSLNFSDAQRSVTFKALLRTESKTLAAIMMIYEKSGETSYFCIPEVNSSEEIWNRCLNDIYESKNSNISPGNMLVIWNYGLMRLSSALADKAIKR